MTDALVWLLVILPPVDWLAALILSSLSHHHPGVLTLRERAIAALVYALVATVAGLLGWAYFGFVDLPDGSVVPILAAVLVLASLPSVYWLLLLVTGRFRIEDEP
jgi:hypothetical protein